MRFAWPVGMNCSSAARIEQGGFGLGRDRTMTSSESYEVLDHPDGLRIHQTAAEVAVLSGAGTGEVADPETLAVQLTAMLPDRVITRDGVFRRLDNLEPFRASVQALWDRTVAAAPEAARPALAPLVARFLDGRSLQAAQAQAWNTGVGFWAGRRMPVGATGLAITVDAPPLLPTHPMQWTYTQKIADRVGCDSGAPEEAPRCLKLVYDGKPSTTDLLKALEASGRAFLAGGVADDIEVEWSDPRLTVHSEIVAEGDTLVPHAGRRETRFYAEARWGGDKVQFLELSDVRQWTTTCVLPK